MKNPVFILLLLIGSTSICFAQKASIEELNEKLATAENDSIRIFCHKELSKKFQYSDLEKLLYHTDKGLGLATANKDTLFLCFFYGKLGKYHFLKSNQDSAFFYLSEALRYSKFLKDKKSYIASLMEYADVKVRNGEVEEGMKMYLEAIPVCEENGYYSGLVGCYFAMANVAGTQKDHQQALEYIQKAAPYCEKIPEHRRASCRSAIIGNYSATHYELKQYDKSIEYGLESAKLKKEANYIMTLDHTYNMIANAYLKKDDPANAIIYHQKALDTSIKLKKTKGIIKASNKLVKLHLQENNLQEAGRILRTQEEKMEDVKNQLTLREYYRLQSLYNEKIKNFPKSTAFYRELVAINDSIMTAERDKSINEIKIKFETEKHKQDKIQALINEEHANESAAKSKWLFITTLISGILALLAGSFLFYQQRLKKRAEIAEVKLSEATTKLQLERKLNNVEKERIESELKALRSQMNPHFIFNSLNSIQDLILREQTEKSYDYIVLFADLVRSTLNHSDEKFIPVENELSFLEVYLSLEKLRFEEDFTYEIDYTGDKDIEVPSLIVQPFIENSLMHGLLHKKGAKKLSVKFVFDDNNLTCIITDNGVGREKSKQIKERQSGSHKSFALEAIKSRMEMLNEQYNKLASYEFIDLFDENEAPTGTKVIISLPHNSLY